MSSSQIEIHPTIINTGTATNEVIGEIPAGTINGSNVYFSLNNTPIKLSLFINGIRLKEIVDYTFSSNIITYVTAPIPGDILQADYNY